MKYTKLIILTLFTVGIIGIAYTSYAATSVSSPRSITIKQQSSGLLISWKKPLSSNYSGFRVYRSQTKKQIGNLLQELKKNTFSFLDSNVSPNNAYFYTIRTIGNKGGESKNTAQVSKVVKVPLKQQPPSQPTAPTLSSPSNGQNFIDAQTITFSWSGISGASYYQFMMRDADNTNYFYNERANTNSYSLYQNIGSNQTSYYWKVRAYDNSGNYKDSDERMYSIGQTAPVTPIPDPSPISYENCVSVVNNGPTDKNYNFVFAFNGLDPQEFSTKAYDYTRAQFYRSEYDVGHKNDPNYGFSQYSTSTYGPNNFTSRLGLFEMEPFKTYVNKFNVFYINHQFDSSTNPFTQVYNECPSLTGSKNMVIVLKHETSPWPGYNAWDLEYMGDTFNHEIGHTFGLLDEYFTDMAKNNLSNTEIADWNTRIPNCDYNHPSTSSDYQTGNGYCTKWCQGVNPDSYQTYKAQRDQYDSCENKLLNKTSLESWRNYCKNTLDFHRIGNPPGVYADTGWIIGDTLEEACNKIYSLNTSNNEHYTENIQRFCYAGTLYNVWDLDIGQSCQSGTGCFAGCGGFGRDSYQRPIGAFGDSGRPEALSIMGGAPRGDSGGYACREAHKNDNTLPSYGAYDIHLIIGKFRELGLIP